MTHRQKSAYSEGQHAAQKAIGAGVPRWMVTQNACGDSIDSATGLPIACMSASSELEEWQRLFVGGYNDEILRAIKSGKVARDFRPLLMSRAEVEDAFVGQPVGILSANTPEIEDPVGRFVIRLETQKSRKVSRPACEPLAWIVIRRAPENHSQRLIIYEAPVDVALGRDRKVILIRTNYNYLTFDVETTQILNRYRIRQTMKQTE